MIDQFFVAAAFIVAGLVCVISIYVCFIWLPRKMEQAYASALRTLATAVETKDSSTLGHAERVAELAVRIAAEMGMSKENIKRIRYAALLRDIGKAAVPHRILNKPEQLTDGELRVVHNHVKVGAEMVSQVPILAALEDTILHHHERWDGSGYPNGLAGQAIPLASRIIGLVDDYEAMTSDRPYHSALDDKHARELIGTASGSLYDPRVVRAFLKVAEEISLSGAREEPEAA